MTRLQDFDAINRERPLTEAEVDELWRAYRREQRRNYPSQTPEGRRARYQRCKDLVNARKRERYATDPNYRARRQAVDRASRARRKGM